MINRMGKKREGRELGMREKGNVEYLLFLLQCLQIIKDYIVIISNSN